MKGRILILCVAVFSLLAYAWGQSAEELIQQADDLYSQMSDMKTAEEALALYRKALLISDDKYEPYWKIARIQYYIGYFSEKKKDKKTIFAQAVYHAAKAVNLESEKPDGYFWRGVNNGKLGEAKGILKSLSLVKPIKADMNKVIELNRAYEDGGPDRVLGRVYFKLPGFAGGDKDKSIEHYQQSLGFGPNDAMTRVYFAETLMDMKQIDKARAELDYIINMEDDPTWTSMVEESKMMARELLKDKKFREGK
jgi:tetratricopeptide (TPR) repeat protein